MFSEVKECILCKGKELTEVVNLGNQYVVDFVPKKDEKLLKAPLVLMKCNSCHLIQLKHRVSQDRLYKKFWYRSGINEQMKHELLAIVQKAQKVVNLMPGDKVLDIGSNDGTLLGWYDKRTVTVGIDPCEELVVESMKEKKVDVGIADYFSTKAIEKIMVMFGLKNRGVKFKIITAVAMFYDCTDPVQFLKDCKAVLDKEGVLVIQMNYLVDMLRDNAYDFICHEHSALYSVSTLTKAVELAGLDFQGLEMSKSNGGSLRAYITHKDNAKFCIDNNQEKLWLNTNHSLKLIDEMKMGLDSNMIYEHFARVVKTNMDKLKAYLVELNTQGKRIYACGASTRGTVLSQYLFRDGGSEIIQGVSDRDEHKHGLHMVGTWWPILPEKEVRKDATHMLTLPWHFRESITKRESEWIQNGGELIFPLPRVEIVNKSQEIETWTHTEAV
jgi:hypothetical protein